MSGAHLADQIQIRLLLIQYSAYEPLQVPLRREHKSPGLRIKNDRPMGGTNGRWPRPVTAPSPIWRYLSERSSWVQCMAVVVLS
jgi:hypothetical protein